MNKLTNILRATSLLVSIAMFIASIPIIISSIQHQKDINDYLKRGLRKEVNIIECRKSNDFIIFGDNYEIKVSYFTKPIFEGGEFKLHPILNYINHKIHKNLLGESKTNIIYFPENPEQSAILEASTKIENFTSYVRLDIGIVIAISGLILFLISRLSKH